MTSHQQSVISYSHKWLRMIQHDKLYIYYSTGCNFVQQPTLVAAFAVLQEVFTAVERHAQGAVCQRI